jgi:hypothetical protein
MNLIDKQWVSAKNYTEELIEKTRMLRLHGHCDKCSLCMVENEKQSYTNHHFEIEQLQWVGPKTASLYFASTTNRS